MSGLKTFPQAPYHDDFDAAKDYLRVLFRPGYAVQTREVNQLQTILQNQIGRMGDHFFENGARIIRGEASVNNKFDYIKVGAGLARVASAYVGTTITGTSGITAKVMYAVDAVGSDPDTLYIQYTSGSGTSVNKFATNETILVTHLDSTSEAIIATEIGVGTIVSLDTGIYYLSNEFVAIPASYYILSKYSSVTTGDYSLGFVVSHDIVTADGDATLFDNAAGTTNFSAPGAHRYKISTTFGTKPIGTSVSSYVEIVRVVDGSIATKVRVDDYTVFQDILATRTFDESGDYVTDEFLLDVREHLRTSTNRGQYSLADGGDESKLVYALDPGKAYVRGYPIETSYNTYLTTDKARTTKSHSNVVISFPYNSAFRVSTTAAFDFGVVTTLKVGSITIGTSTVRDVRFVSTGVVDVDMINIVMLAGYGLSDVTSIVQGSSTGTVSTYFYDATESSLIFSVPFGYVSNLSSVALSYRRTFNVNGSGSTVILTAPDTFSINTTDYVCQYSHSGGTACVAPLSVSAPSSGSATLTLPHTPTSIVKIVAGLTKAAATYRSKTAQTQTDTISASGNLKLTKTDGIAIASILLGSVDVTSAYSFDNGQRDTVYDYCQLVAKAGAPSSGSLVVTYSYFNHSSGDFFCKNSYSVDYASIPSYTTTSGNELFLGSVLDFRRSVTAGGVDYVAGFASSFTKNSVAICDYSIYMSRYDKIIVDKFGKFIVKVGEPSEAPVPPAEVSNGLTLYTVLVNPYTFNNTDVVINQAKNRRYTMRDIGKIDSRLETVEYYTSLNLLEKQTIDQTFVNKFNTGFLVDSFKSQAIADNTSASLQIGFDLNAGEIRPQTPSKFVPLGLKTASGASVVDNVLMLNYTQVPYVSQPLASEIQRIQPYIRYQWEGNLVLVPNSDSWTSTKYLPDIIVDGGVFNVTKNAVDPRSGLDSWVDFSRGDLIINTSVATTTATTQSADSFVGNAPIPFIRSRLISMTGTGMKPNTKLNFFFDDVDVAAYIRPIGGSYGASISTNGVGSFTAEFLIPETDSLRFRTGNRTMKITDGAASSVGSTTSSAVYAAEGIEIDRQKSLLKTRTVTTTRTAVGINTPMPDSSDPLAESFVVDSDVGAFVSGIDLFFGPDAATNTAPVTVYLRTMENGYPTTNTIAKSTLLASGISGSSNGFTATRFTFPHPVYLEGNKEYAFVVKTDSEVLTLWTATLGAKSYQSTDIADPTGQYITKQTYLGSLFRSQNDKTWTAEQASDIKFTLYRADFASSGTATLTNQVPMWDIHSPYKEDLYNPFSFTTGSNVVVVKHYNHGFGTTDTVTFSGMTSGTIAGIPFGELFGTSKSVTKIDTDTYSVQTTTNAASTIISGGSVGATASVIFGEAMLSANDIIPSATTLKYGLSTKVKGGVQQAAVDVVNKNVTKFNSVRHTNVSGDDLLAVSATISTTNSYVSPVVDLYDTGVVCIANRVNGTASPSVATYVQKPITLKNAASEFITYLDVNRPAGSTLDVYYRVAQDNVTNLPWILAAPANSQEYASSDSDFFEYKLVPSAPTGDFFVIQIKIEMKSDNEAKVPRARGLRTITLKS